MTLTQSLALGPIAMLHDAIWRHRYDNYGAAPRRIELHPRVYADLIWHLHAKGYYRLPTEGGINFEGVVVVENEAAILPMLITCGGRVEYL